MITFYFFVIVAQQNKLNIQKNRKENKKSIL